MANTQHKPVPHSTPAAASPVADARARALQERIRTLREQARQAGDRLLEATERNREQRLQEWEQAEQACRQAEQEMARLRARSLGATPASDPGDQAPPPARIDPDQDWDRRQAAAAALNLLERATQPHLQNSPILDQGLARPSDTANVTAAGIDFGPLVEETPAPAPPAKHARVTETPPPAPRPATSPPPLQALNPPASPTPVPRSGNRPRRNAQIQGAAPVKQRPRFGFALLIGAVLGAGGMLLAATFIQNPSMGLAVLEQVQQLQQAGQDAMQSLWQRLLPLDRT
jgi:hypothetical protein